MSPWGTVRLVAGREVRARLRSRLFVWGTVALSLLLTLLATVPALLVGAERFAPLSPPDDERAPLRVAVVGDLDTVERRAVEHALDRAELTTVDAVETAREALRTDAADVAVVPGSAVLVPPRRGVLDLGSPQAQRIAEALALAGTLGDDARVGEVLGTDPLPVTPVDDERGTDPATQLARLVLANVALILLFGVLMMYSSMIINGVIEEKGNRVVELLVAAVPVRQLMGGKVLGLGLVGLGQTLALFGPPVLVLTVTAGDRVPPGVAGLAGAVALWFALGYSLYAVIAAGLGSLVSRPEEAQAVLTPANLLMIAGYGLGFLSVNAPDTVVARVASLVPFTAPYAMVVRQAVASPPAGEVALAVGLMLVTIAGAGVLAARVYEGGILRVGARVQLGEAWRRQR